MPSIIAGCRRGAKLLVPEGLGVRPTLARAREALFSMIASQIGSYAGIHVLDPFAGSGALGLEAFSRGAGHVDFVEASRSHYELLLKNIRKLDAAPACTALLGRTPAVWPHLKPIQYQLVLCDPPYAAGLLPETLDALIARRMLADRAIVSLELDPDTPVELPAQLAVLKTRQYAQCKFILTRFCASDPSDSDVL